MNVQNIPRKDKVIKKAFVPKLDAFLFFDFEQVELRFLAFYMATLGDFSMVEAFNEGKDIHEESASAVLGKAPPLKDEERQVGKTFNYATTYGQGINKCALTLGVSYEEAEQMLFVFQTRWPGIKVLHNLKRREQPGVIQNQLNRVGYIKTLHGRHLHPEKPHKALNTLVQGAAADLMRASLVKVDKCLKEKGLESHIVNAVHDEIILDVAKKDVPFLVETIPVLMGNETIEKYLPVTVEVEISEHSWADKRKYSPEVSSMG